MRNFQKKSTAKFTITLGNYSHFVFITFTPLVLAFSSLNGGQD